MQISIHALREEGDNSLSTEDLVTRVFLSTPSARRATGCPHSRLQRLGISIHALREEGDNDGRVVLNFKWISIHALREEGDLLP